MDKRTEYVDAVVDRYTGGENGIFATYAEVYVEVFDEYNGEPVYGEPTIMTDVDFIARCASLDYDDGPLQGAAFQDIYDALQNQ